MAMLYKYLRQSATYRVFKHFMVTFTDFLDTLGKIAQIGYHVLIAILKGDIEKKELLTQCDRFGVSSLPITLSIVGMTSIIVASQVAHEMVKQGGSGFVGLLMTILIVREVGAIMSGFAITSMIGSSLASELATMRVTEQVDAIDVLGVDSVNFLFVPRVLSGIIMMPFVVILASVVGVLLGAVTSDMFAGLSYRAYFDSAWLGLYMKDLWSHTSFHRPLRHRNRHEQNRPYTRRQVRSNGRYNLLPNHSFLPSRPHCQSQKLP